jgi:16S rRNA (cytosine1402-N4)-methyltransferase
MAPITTGHESAIHVPVLVKEVVFYMEPKPGGLYLDVTLGAGGHSRALLEAEPRCRIIGLDWDKVSIDSYGAELCQEYGDRCKLIWGNFAQLYAIAKRENIQGVDGIIADFGTSYMQLSERAGFSFNRDTPLDMRMSPAHQLVTAEHVVNTASEEKLKSIFLQFGQERHAVQIARALVDRRQRKKFRSTLDLAKVVAGVVLAKDVQRRQIHPATKVFQALRIFVNHELDNIRALLAAAVPLLKPGGRIICISFHSLEDRLVKDFYRDQEARGMGRVVTKKVVVPSEEERKSNPSSRSSKLRVFERAV